MVGHVETRGTRPRASWPAAALGGLVIANAAVGQSLDSLIAAEENRIEQAQEAQREIDAIAQATRARFDAYRLLLKEIDGLAVYNELLEAQIDDQHGRLEHLRASIDEVTVIERRILPLMTRMIDALEAFIELDVPFRREERLDRVETLRRMLGADVTVAEQLRNVMEAWQTEIDYGRFPDTYRGRLEIGDVVREVDFLMIGRIALYYVTPDDRLAGAWDRRTRSWVALSASDAQTIRAVIDGLGSDAPPDRLYMLPVAPPQADRGQENRG
ncbi:MAG TPA: DUF3450 domain-containing protein [Gammaproteobacteria bacterium]